MPPKKVYNNSIQSGSDILLNYYVTQGPGSHIICTISTFVKIMTTTDPENISGYYGGFNNAKENQITPNMSNKLKYVGQGGGVINKQAYYNVLIPTDLGDMHYEPIKLGELTIDHNGRITLGEISALVSNTLIFNVNMFVYDRNGKRITDLGTFLNYDKQVTIYFHLLPYAGLRELLTDIDRGKFEAIDLNGYNNVSPYIYNIGNVTPNQLRNNIAEIMAMAVDTNNNNLINIENEGNNNNADYKPEDERNDIYTDVDLPSIRVSEDDDIRNIIPTDPSDKKVFAILGDMKQGLYSDVNPDDIPDDFIPEAPILDDRGILNAPPPVRPLNVPNLVYGARAIRDRAREAGELVRVADELILQNAELQAGLQQAMNREQARALYRAEVIARLQDAALINAQINYNRYARQLALISAGCVVLASYGVYLLYAYKGSYANILVDTVLDWVLYIAPNANELDRRYNQRLYNELYDPNRPTQTPEDNTPYYGFEQQILNDLCDRIKTNIPEADLFLPYSIPIRYWYDQISTLPIANFSVSQAYEYTAEIGSLLTLANAFASLSRSSEPGLERLRPTQLDHLMGPVTAQALGYVGNAMMPLPNTPTGLIESEPYSPSSLPTTTQRSTPRSRSPSYQQAPWRVNYNKNEPIPTSTPYSDTPSVTFTPTPTPSVSISVSPELAEKLPKHKGLSEYIKTGAVYIGETLGSIYGWVETKLGEGYNLAVYYGTPVWENIKANGWWLASKLTWGAVDIGIEVATQSAKLGLHAISKSTGLIITAAAALVGYVFIKNR